MIQQHVVAAVVVYEDDSVILQHFQWSNLSAGELRQVQMCNFSLQHGFQLLVQLQGRRQLDSVQAYSKTFAGRPSEQQAMQLGSKFRKPSLTYRNLMIILNTHVSKFYQTCRLGAVMARMWNLCEFLVGC